MKYKFSKNDKFYITSDGMLYCELEKVKDLKRDFDFSDIPAEFVNFVNKGFEDKEELIKTDELLK